MVDIKKIADEAEMIEMCIRDRRGSRRGRPHSDPDYLRQKLCGQGRTAGDSGGGALKGRNMTKRIWSVLLALGMALTVLPSGMYAEETVWEEEANASEETLDGGLDESAEEFADSLPDYIPESEEDVVDGAAGDESADALPEDVYKRQP